MRPATQRPAPRTPPPDIALRKSSCSFVNPTNCASQRPTARCADCGNCVCVYARLRIAPCLRTRKACIGQKSVNIHWGNIMSLIKWQPFGDFDDAFNRLMPSLFSRFPRSATENGGKFEWAPSADISETDQEYLIRAELPAVKEEDVKVTLDQGMITIHGERTEDKETKDEKFHRVES